mgnify:CR=1 FL=1
MPDRRCSFNPAHCFDIFPPRPCQNPEQRPKKIRTPLPATHAPRSGAICRLNMAEVAGLLHPTSLSQRERVFIGFRVRPFTLSYLFKISNAFILPFRQNRSSLLRGNIAGGVY